MEYQHSVVFDTLKRTVEEIDVNLTSAQYLHTLDYFLWQALTLLAHACPSLFFNWMAKVVAHQTLNPSSKFTSDDKNQMPILFFNSLTLRYADNSMGPAISEVQKMYLNRGFLFGLLAKFLREAASYTKLTSAFVNNPMKVRSDIAKLEQRLGVEDGVELYHVLRDIEHWDTKARSWKDKIVQKYTRMTILAAQKTYVDFNHSVGLDDVSQLHLMVTAKAIDRCDPRVGVLTSFIQQWLKSARAETAKLAKGQGDDSFEYLEEVMGDSLDLGSVDPDSTSEVLQELSYKAQVKDPVGIVRITLGIPQYVNARYKKTLLDYAIVR